jgi:signal transduction histidine kinase
VRENCFAEKHAVEYCQGRIRVINDIYNSSLSDCHIQFLDRLQVRASIVVPLIEGDELWGLLCIHQCAHPRQWRDSEVEFVIQIATQLGVALQQAELLAKTQEQTEQLTRAIRELQQTQTQLIQTEKMSSLGQLVAGIAHEINNPVNFIYGNLSHASQYAQDLLEHLELYQKYYPQRHPEIADHEEEIELDFLTADLPKILTSMKVGAERIRQMVLSLRNFSRLDQSEKKAVNLHEGIDSTLLILQHRLKMKTNSPGIQVIKEYSDLPLINCYPGPLNQVFMNVLSNAIDALDQRDAQRSLEEITDSPSQIIISTALISDQSDNRQSGTEKAIIKITDNGTGIPQEVINQIFNPFFTTKPVGKGTGLGLSISYQIVVEKHGGDFRCNSLPGKGTEFWIEIPIK